MGVILLDILVGEVVIAHWRNVRNNALQVVLDAA
jgi:hypothetical protein